MTDDTVAHMGWGISAQEQIDGFRKEVRELKAENALLWEQGALLFDKTLELGTENTKLRELVRNLLRVIPRDVSGVVIGVHGEHPTYYSFADAMRELEVG